MPDAKTIWLFREQLTRAGAVERLFARFDRVLREAGYLAMGGQIVDATVIQAGRPRLTRGEKGAINGGAVPEGWSKAKRAQKMDTDGRWTLKRGRKRAAGRSERHERTQTELVIPVLVTRTTSGSTAGTASSAASRWPTPPLTTVGSSAGCSIRTTPRAPSGPTAPIARRQTSPS